MLSQNLKSFSNPHNLFLVKITTFNEKTIDEEERFHYLFRDSKKRNIEMIEDDEKDLLKKKLEESKEEIIKLNSQIDELFQVRLECEENASKLLKLFDSGDIDKDGNPIIR